MPKRKKTCPTQSCFRDDEIRESEAKSPTLCMKQNRKELATRSRSQPVKDAPPARLDEAGNERRGKDERSRKDSAKTKKLLGLHSAGAAPPNRVTGCCSP